jgi:hypothetical protein
MPLSLANLLQ